MSAPAELPRLCLTITATRRWQLLQQALDSLTAHLLPNIQLAKVYVNIDPVYGDGDDALQVTGVLDRWLGQAMRPPCYGSYRLYAETPSHGAAVKWLWGRYMGEHPAFLHWEDDFVAETPITWDQVEAMLAIGAGMAAFNHQKLGSGHGTLCRRTKDGEHRLGTSPRFVSPGFGACYSRAIDPSLCPEKQTYASHRTPAWDEVFERPDAKALILNRWGRYPVRHLGEDWNQEHGVTREHVGPRIVRRDAEGRAIS